MVIFEGPDPPNAEDARCPTTTITTITFSWSISLPINYPATTSYSKSITIQQYIYLYCSRRHAVQMSVRLQVSVATVQLTPTSSSPPPASRPSASAQAVAFVIIRTSSSLEKWHPTLARVRRCACSRCRILPPSPLSCHNWARRSGCQNYTITVAAVLVAGRIWISWSLPL